MVEKNKRRPFKDRLEPYLLLLPALLLFGTFTYYPFLRTVYLSFHLVNAKGAKGAWVGVENYQRILTDGNFLRAVGNTFRYALIAVPLCILIALLLALLSNKRRPVSRVSETMFALPMAMSMAVSVLVFQFMLNPGLGIINHWLGRNIEWFGDRDHLFVVLVVICVWLSIGFDFLYLLAAVRNVPVDVVECAEIEGAGIIKKTLFITVPMISPSLFFLLCTELTKALMMSAPLIIIGKDWMGTNSLQTTMYYMYVQAFQNYNFSYAFPAAIVGFAITFLVILASFLIERKGVHYS